MAKSSKGAQEVEQQVVVELDADGEFGAAIKALQEAAWRLRMASYNLEEEHAHLPPSTMDRPYRPMELGACMASAELLAMQIDAVSTQARRLRKRARDI